MKELGKPNYFLGIKVAYSKQGIFISQRKYVLDLLKEIGKLGCKTLGNHRIGCEENPTIEKSKYQRLVGKSIYFSHNRSDIVYVVSVVSQFMRVQEKDCCLGKKILYVSRRKSSNMEDQETKCGCSVLVGTGSRTMTIVKIKSLKVYAFGFYIHPYSLCEKLGPKYASISADELNNRHDFYKDLLREDINMTIRLVVNCRGMKINSVKDAFEKSLRARLLKTNPSTDFNCITTFGSYFTENIPIPLGTVIEFKRTVDGRLITKISGNQIGSVHSKDLCRAFFDMYIGDVPVCEQTKKEIGMNAANIIRRC
ncbi:Fatty-acid-binding protein 2, partial [Mucuna pruriens]